MIARTPTGGDSARLWHPWLRIQRLIRVILETRWGTDEWWQAYERVTVRRAATA